ncbi:hypothetical protein Mp_Vg00110 [Marchantia polymorpha subsp. ruderalis]|uniref:Uncharacterized protein n=1 Tax=Marchantia polymorpha TaxID=3197 RepID=A0A2R6VWW7_MARPO|nr:hypothetical protein MARPO_YB0039 [Marchantia polymorpha]BBN20454.1 hypothetical protein Mp_Vg00110 [Marchantia polymorpha subsp. ruderalis]|eukprot:PTQ26098.1 hypothetical protein MARPO_YB0039 [Marchantia polymorpha]
MGQGVFLSSDKFCLVSICSHVFLKPPIKVKKAGPRLGCRRPNSLGDGYTQKGDKNKRVDDGRRMRDRQSECA